MRQFVLAMFVVIMIVSGIAAPSDCMAGEPPQGGLGLMASIQNDQFDIIVPGWVTANIVIAPAVRLISVTNGDSDIGLGGIIRFYKRESTVSPYIGVRAMALIFSPNRGDGWTDVLIGGAVGGDYFIDQHLSIGIEAQINAASSADSSTRFGNPGGTSINSAMGAFAAIYF